jgi:hypothetical protein
MYRQGLGDCFLLTFPGPGRGRESHMLIDCGVLKGTEDASARIARAAESIVETTGGRLDALVVTHEHWDHVSGFLQAEDVFNRLDVGEVWLAWTEDPADDLARSLSDRRKKAAGAVEEAARAMRRTGNPDLKETVRQLDGLLGFFPDDAPGLGVGERQTTARAMEWVKSRADGRVRYFQPGVDPIHPPGTDCARVYVLGPPRDPKALRRSAPSARASEVYELAELDGPDHGFLDAVDALADDEAAAVEGQPFNKWFTISEAEAWHWDLEDFFGAHYGFEEDDGQGWRRIEHDWLGPAGRLALQLDSHTNNTSLALAFELIPSGRVLLFPGDAQVGNWASWSGKRWQVREGSADRTVTTEDLLARTVLYKVGHHGSHNATLRELGLELMTSRELAAMLPVDRATAKKMRWNMPFPALHRRLREKTSGRILDLETGVPTTPPPGTNAREWREFQSRCRAHPDWIDYEVEL